MEEFETTSQDPLSGEGALGAGEKRTSDIEPAEQVRAVLRQLILFVCCGPGVVGFLWLIGRILRR